MSYDTTPAYNIKYPLADEEMNIPEDMEILAESVETAMLNLVNNNLIRSATARINTPPEPADYCAAVVTGGVLNLIFPRVVADPNKLSTSGGTIAGNLNVTGIITTPSPTSLSGPTQVATKGYVDASTTPIGGIIMWTGTSSTVPTGWALCDGSAHGSTILQNVSGSPNTPDLRDKFIIGKSPTKPVGSNGGNANVTLTVNELPSHGHTTDQASYSHNHTGTTEGMTRNTTHTHPLPTVNPVNLNHEHPTTVNTVANHSHTFSDTSSSAGAHIHQIQVNEGTPGTGEDGNYVDTEDTMNGADKTVGQTTSAGAHTHAISGTTSLAGTHTHTVAVGQLFSTTVGAAAITAHTHVLTQSTLPPPDTNHEHTFTTNTNSYTHQHNVNNTGGGQAFSILPTYYALAFIVFKGL